jgi:hypothetical protein
LQKGQLQLGPHVKTIIVVMVLSLAVFALFWSMYLYGECVLIGGINPTVSVSICIDRSPILTYRFDVSGGIFDSCLTLISIAAFLSIFLAHILPGVLLIILVRRLVDSRFRFSTRRAGLPS